MIDQKELDAVMSHHFKTEDDYRYDNVVSALDNYSDRLASKIALKQVVIGRFLPPNEDGYCRCANCGKWNSAEEVKAKTLL